MNKIWRVWLACLLETEGCLGIHKNTRSGQTPRFNVDIRVSMTDIEYVKKAFDITKLGSLKPQKRRTKSGKRVFAWRVGGAGVEKILNLCRPYLLIKHRQADLMLRLINDIRKRSFNRHNHTTQQAFKNRDKWYREVRELNR